MVPYLVARFLFAMLGTAIGLQLLWFLRLNAGNRAATRSGHLLAAVALGAFGADLISAAVLVAGYSVQTLAYIIPCNISFAAMAFVPSIVFNSWRHSSPRRKSSRGFRALIVVSTGGAAILSAMLWMPHDTFLSTDAMHAGIAVYDLVVILIGTALFRTRDLSDSTLLCLSITRNAAVAGTVALVLTIATRYHPSLFIVCFVVQQMSLLAAVLASFIFFAQFRYADVFATRSVQSIGLGFLSAATLLLIRSLAALIGGGLAGMLVNTIAIASSISLAVWAGPRLDVWVTRRLLRQPDLRTALEIVATKVPTFESEDELIEWIDINLSTTLSIASSRTVPATMLDDRVLAQVYPFGDVLELNLSRGDMDGTINVLVPVMIDNVLRFVINICPGRARRALLSSEVQFLRAVARHFASGIRRIESESRNRQRQLHETLLKSQVAEAELRALRAQIQPHFLFNSLNTIADLIVTRPQSAERMTLRLASVFRHVLKQSDRQMVTLREEFEFLHNYLQIEEERFGERLRVTFALDPAAAEACIPTLLLQPLIENALKHGLAPKQQGGSLFVRAKLQESMIKIQVEDDGVGYRGGPTSLSSEFRNCNGSAGVGLSNTFSRLKTSYGERASITIKSGLSAGCCVSIAIPAEGAFLCAV